MNVRSSRSLVFGAALVLAGTLDAAAQDFDPRSVDVDGDGSITAAEVRQVSSARFKAMDRNGDGQLSEAEFTDARLALMQSLDSNQDGVVERSELRGQWLKRRG
ncbi:MAG: EF-hand domain-containing protein [Nevskia sp.]|nr:EF-hand domain-containing protein [Nevskia sp.]